MTNPTATPVAEHTPGPWYIRDEHPGGATFNIGTTPADAYRNEVAVIFRTGKLPIHKANANLIAAAPELLVLAARTVTSVIARSALVRVAREANHRMLRCSYLGSHLEGGA